MTAHTADVEQRLRRLEDRQELSDLVADYGIAVDDRDLERLADLYAGDAVFEHATGRSTGRQGVIDYYRARLARFGPTFHFPHSQTVEFRDDDHAAGVVAAHAELVMDGTTIVTAIRYYDEYVREAGRWRFRERVVRFLYTLPLAELPTRMGDALRKRWPDAEPAPADLPDTMPSYRRYLASLSQVDTPQT